MDIVIGAGMGGLAAAAHLAGQGRAVTVIEARGGPGGLAGPLEADGVAFDGGPYLLLDRPGLSWAFEQLGETLEDHVALLPVDEVVRVHGGDGPPVCIHGDLERTVAGIEARWPGHGERYRRFATRMVGAYQALAPLQRVAQPRPWHMLREGRLRFTPLLLRSLEGTLRASGLPQQVADAVGVWAHIAGRPLGEAPATVALVTGIVHSVGAWTVRGGMHRVPLALEAIGRARGVAFRYGAKVERIGRQGGRITGLVVDGEPIPVGPDALVVSNAPGIGTCTELVDPPDPALTRRLAAWPLQSPGVGAWILHEGHDVDVPFVDVHLDGGTRFRVHPGSVDPDRVGRARILAPTDHAWAGRVGPEGQRRFLEEVLAGAWWRGGLAAPRVVATRIPSEWGRRMHLHRDSMNPAMTRDSLVKGRLPHRGLLAENLRLTGSATHPGQWVSFCAISGVLAARP